jgi:hypothetical protein
VEKLNPKDNIQIMVTLEPEMIKEPVIVNNKMLIWQLII